MSFQPHLYIDIGARNHYFTLRETYLHVQYVKKRIYNEVRSIHHFNLSQDATEALQKAQSYAEYNGIPLYSSAETMEQEMAEIRRATEEQLAAREAVRIQQEREWAAASAQRDQDKINAARNGVMPFGKHKGDSLNDMPAGYLSWILRNEFDGEVWVAMREWIMANRPDAVLPVADKDKTYGAEGERIDVDVTVIRKNCFSGMYGITYIISMVTADGAMLVSKGKFVADVGENIRIRGTIKEHSRYNDQMQTVVQRVKELKSLTKLAGDHAE